MLELHNTGCTDPAMPNPLLFKVLLNGERLPIKSFMEYVELYLPDKSVPRIHERVSERWEVVIAATSGQFQQVMNPLLTPAGN